VVALLQRVQGLEQDQLLPVLKAAAGLLALPSEAATEEVRCERLCGVAVLVGKG
jgi:hypothetical protein